MAPVFWVTPCWFPGKPAEPERQKDTWVSIENRKPAFGGKRHTWLHESWSPRVLESCISYRLQKVSAFHFWAVFSSPEFAPPFPFLPFWGPPFVFHQPGKKDIFFCWGPNSSQVGLALWQRIFRLEIEIKGCLLNPQEVEHLLQRGQQQPSAGK